MFTKQDTFDLLTLGCNAQWLELMETCRQRIDQVDSAIDASNLTRAIELFIFSDFTSENRSEYPVDFILRRGDLQMFLTCVKLANFDINDDRNHPLVINEIIPYAAQHNNWPIATYLIAIIDMECRISLLENSLADLDETLVRTLLIFVTPAYYKLGVAKLFEQRRLQLIFLSRRFNYSVVSQRIIHFLDLKTLFVFRSASKKFQIAVDRETRSWKDIYDSQKDALLKKIEKISANVKKVKISFVSPVQWENEEINSMVFYTAQWLEFIKKIENIRNVSQTRYLSQIYYRVNDRVRVSNLGPILNPLNCQQWIRDQFWRVTSPMTFCLFESNTELFFKLILPHVDIPAYEFHEHNAPFIKRVIDSENLQLVKIVEPYIDLNLTALNGSNVFHLAVLADSIGIFEYFLNNANHADPKKQNDFKKTPYDLVRSYRMEKFLESRNLGNQ